MRSARNKHTILSVLIFFSLAGFAQTQEDSMMFKTVNQFRIIHQLPRLSWDTAFYNEAADIYKFQVLDTVEEDGEENDSVLVFAGVWGEYFTASYIYDGEIDSTTAPFFTKQLINDIESVTGERLIFENPKAAHYGACLFEKKTVYLSYPEWLLTFIIGVAY